MQEETAKYDKICEAAFSMAKRATAVRNRDWLDSPWDDFFTGKDPMLVPKTGIDDNTMKHIGKFT